MPAHTQLRNRHDWFWRLITCVVITLSVLAFEQTTQSALAQLGMPMANDEAFTVAVLSFDALDGHEHLGDMIHDTVEAMLSGHEAFTVVERDQLDRTLSEMGLTLSGTADPASVLKLGRVIGARLLVTGKAFELGESRMLTAKIIGTETTLTEAVFVKAELDTPLDAMVFELAEKLSEKLLEAGPRLVASDDPADPLPQLIEALADTELPVLAVVIPEEHRRRLVPAVPPDPAVETEIKRILIQAGAQVRDVHDNALAAWIQDYETGSGQTAWPRTLQGVDVVIAGEAFSESAGQLGSLRLATARAEINAIARKDGKILFADATTARGIDLAEKVAGKTALQKAGRVLGQHLLAFLRDRQEQASPLP